MTMSHKMALDKVNTQWISVGFPLIEALGKKLRFKVRRIFNWGGDSFRGERVEIFERASKQNFVQIPTQT